MNKQRFFIDTEGNDDEAYREAIQFACEIADKDPEISRIILLVYTKQNTGWLDRLFGEKTVKEMFSGKRFSDCNPVIKIETIKTYKGGYSPSQIIITFGLPVEEVYKLDDSYSAKVIIAVPWLKNSLQKWVQTWNPMDLRKKEKTLLSIPEPSSAIKKAFQDLTKSINMSTGISHYMDNDLAKTYILALHKYEPVFDAEITASYLVRELGWDVKDANDIKKLISTLNEGKYFKGGSRTGLKSYYKRWQDKSK